MTIIRNVNDSTYERNNNQGNVNNNKDDSDDNDNNTEYEDAWKILVEVLSLVMKLTVTFFKC